MRCSINVVQTLTGTLSEERNWAGKWGKDAAQVFPCSARHLQDMLMSVLHSIMSDGFL